MDIRRHKDDIRGQMLSFSRTYINNYESIKRLNNVLHRQFCVL